MHHVLVSYPKFDMKTEESIEAFRRKYDPFADCMKPHITFVFPVPCSEVDEAELTEHVEKVLANWKPFPIHMAGFTKSRDHWLFLLLKEGNREAIALHDELCTGILSPYLRRDIEYVPHIGIGLFVRKGTEYNVLDPKDVAFDAKLYSRALEEAESLKISSYDTIDRLFLKKIIVRTDVPLHRPSLPMGVFVETVSSKEIKL